MAEEIAQRSGDGCLHRNVPAVWRAPRGGVWGKTQGIWDLSVFRRIFSDVVVHHRELSQKASPFPGVEGSIVKGLCYLKSLN